jgi:hypothetical protein
MTYDEELLHMRVQTLVGEGLFCRPRKYWRRPSTYSDRSP